MDSTSEQQYQYRQLRGPASQIRLLHLHPSTSFNSPLTGHLVEVEQLSDLQYEAVSYVWGPPIFDHDIELEGQVLHITKSLSNVLRSLRLEESPRTLWVDAICINQADLDERSRQVTKMKSIFEASSCCLAWIGPAPDVDDQHYEPSIKGTIAAIQLFNDMQTRDPKTLYDMKDSLLQHRDGQRYIEKSDGQTLYALSWEQKALFTSIFQRHILWRRIWIMQELCCSPSVKLVAGSATLDLALIEKFLHDKSYSDAFHASFGHGSLAPAISRIFTAPKFIVQQRALIARARIDGPDVHPSTLFDTLARFRHATSTDPRDVIYGLLGMVSDLHSVVVDYRKSTALVFAETAWAIIEGRRDLDVVCQNPWAYPRPEPRPEGLPSWAADFSNTLSADGNQDELLFAQRSIFAAGRPQYDISRGLMQGIGLPGRGIVIDRLGPIEPFHILTGLPETQFLVQRDRMEAYFPEGLLGPDPGTYEPTGESRLQAFWRTIMMDCTAYPIARLTKDEIRDKNEVMKFLFTVEGRQWSWTLGQETISLDNLKMLLRNQNKWYFSTTETELFVMVRREAKEGDIVAILDGAKVPLLLRPAESSLPGECFEAVCPVYVHGYMDGRALDRVADGSLTERDIVLV